MNSSFSVTYSIVTPESAEQGDVNEVGFIYGPADNATLRECIQELFSTRTSKVGGIECCGAESNGYIVSNSAEFETGAQETRALYIDPNSGITDASKARLFKLLDNQ